METSSFYMYRYSEYKRSGIEWLSLMPKHWAIKRSKFILSYKRGKNPKAFTKENTGLIYLSMEYLRSLFADINYVNKETGMVEVNEGDILILWDGSNAGEFVKGKQGVLSSTMALIEITISNKKFGWYYLKAIERHLKSSTIGMGIPHVSTGELKNMPFLIPPLSEQTAIADFLDQKTAQIDRAIAQKERLIELLIERRQTLIHKAVTRGLNPDVKIKDSGVEWIGEIPEHWEVSLNKVLFKETKFSGRNDLPILSVSIHTGVSNEELDDQENKRGKIRIQDKEQYKYVNKGDIVFNMMRAWQGAIGAVSTEGVVSPAYIVARPTPSIDPEFFEFQYRTPAFILQMDRFSKGITDFRKRLYWPEFKQLRTVVPPTAEQQQITNYIKAYEEKAAVAISIKQQQIQKLKEYKASLIDAAVTGKIKVPQ